VVDPFTLTSDILANTVSLILPAVVWALLFLLAFEHPSFAESIGFGRRAFWLLFAGSLLASFAILPFGAVANDIIAVSFGGAIFPLLVGSLALRRVGGGGNRLLAEYLLFLAVGSAVMLVLVLPLAAPLVAPLAAHTVGGSSTVTVLLLLIVAVVLVLAATFVPEPAGGSSGPSVRVGGAARPLVFLLGLTALVLLGTYAASSAIPGVGIVEQFPYFLLPPIAAGALAVLAAPRFLPDREGFALPVAFLATTFGVLLGADLLHQPPLYGSGPAGLYTIGGAGVLDLVYLSGLLALGTAYLFHRALGRPLAPVGPPVPAAAPTPIARLGRAFRAGVDGDLPEALTESSRAGHEAAAQARTLLGLAPAPPERPWEGLPVPGWVVSDQANLDAAARAGSTDGREGFRAWLTARWLVYLGRDLGQRRFGAPGARSLGFLLDLAIVTAPAVAIWTAIVLATPGGLDAVLTSLPFNAAIYGYISLAFLYLALSETLTGSSLGKRGLGLVVRDRSFRPIGLVSALVRNATVLPSLTVVGLGGALGVAFLLKAGTLSSVTVGGLPLPGGLFALAGVLAFLVAGVGLLGAFGFLVIAVTSERQRLGDLLAGTWVVREASPVLAGVPSVPTGAAASAPPPPSGSG
jgi:uncharacterized membrane protein/uncharacterized RDD family membrane protein YckC